MHTPLLANRLSRWLVVTLLALLSTSAAWAQSTANYAFTTSSTGSLVDMSTGTTNALATGVYRDDDASTVQPIGFTFVFMGTPYTQFSVNSNGQLRLGATAISGTNALPASGAAILGAFGGDNAMQATGRVAYKVVAGTNRTLVVEWTGLRIPYAGDPAAGTPTQVQVVLEENTGKIEYRYGTAYNNSTSVTRAIFISAGTSAGQIGVVKTFNTTPTYDATVTSATTTSLTDNAPIGVLNSTTDGSRTVFTFTPTVVPAVPTVAFTNVSQTSLTVSITDNSTNEYGFSVLRSSDNITFTSVGTVATSSTTGTGSTVTLAQTGLTANTTYYYKVAANGEGYQSFTAAATVATPAAVPICGTKAVGPGAGADYATLTAAFSAIFNNGLCGPLVLELQSSYLSTAETFPLVYNFTGATATNTVTVRPAAGATGLSITGTGATAVMSIVGGKYLIIDGRPGGSGTTVSGAAAATDLTISSTSTSGIPLQFTSDATFNTVQHVQIKGVGTSDSGSPDVNFTGTVTTTGNSDNTVQYCNIGDGATTPVTLIYGGNALNARNSILNNNLFNNYGTGSTYGVYLNQTGAGWIISGNSFYQTASRASVSGTMYGIFINANNGHTVSGNFLGGSAPSMGGTPLTTTGTSAYRYAGIYLVTTTGTPTSVQGNSVGNITWSSSSGATTTYGILSGIYVNTGDVNIGTTAGNTIGGASAPISVTSSTTGGYAFGISSASSNAINITGNTISNITGAGSATVAVNVAGILSSTGSPTISRNKIYNLAGGSAAAGTVATLSTGIWLTGGTTTTVTNNLIGDLRAATSTSLVGVTGLLVSGGTTVNAYYNTINLAATSTGATFGTSGIYLNSTATVLDLRNNIVVNKSTAVGTGGYTVALRRVSGTTGTIPTNLATTSNNNLYYAGVPSATNLIYVEGTTTATNPQQTIAAYRNFLILREQASVTEDVPFVSTTGTATTFLHISTTTPTQVERGGTPIASITTDFDGDTRDASFPDIGADEGTFQPLDLVGPTITFTTLGSSSNTSTRTLVATIIDPSGIATGANAPRLYFRRSTGSTFAFVNPTSVSGNQYTFTIDYALLTPTGVAPGDIIQYYVAAQDVAGNVSTNPGGGGGTPPGTAAQPFIYSFTVLGTLSGTYYVGTSTSPDPTRTYTTLTAAVNAYNTNGLAGPVTFLLLDATYSTAETFPINILNNPEASATNTLTIKPNTGVTSAVTGTTGTTASVGLLQLLGSDYVTLDGSNGGTISSTDPRPSRDLTITNTSTVTTTSVVQQFAQFTNDGATFNTIKNLVAVGTTTAATAGTLYGVLLQGTSNAITANQYTNNTVQNVAVRATQVGIASVGGGISLKTQNTVITQNDLNAAVGAGALTRNGILVTFDNNTQVTQNTIGNIVSSSDVSGISLGFGISSFANSTFTGNEVTNALVSRNSVGVVNSTGTFSAVGIGVATATSGTNTIVNNMVSGVASNGTSGDFGAGIFVNGSAGGGTTRVLYNSVSMTGNNPGTSAATQPNFAFAIGGSSPTVEVRNNVLYNAQTITGASSYAIGFAYAGTTGNYAGLTSSNNAFFGANGTGMTGTLASGTVRATLADLNVETGQDRPTTATAPAGTSLTLAGSPFVSATDLHVSITSAAGLALNGAAVPVAGITVDFDNETRNATTPDIGADEFRTNLDIAAVALVSPVPGNSCFSSTEAVTVSIRNASTVALDFSLNPVTVTVTITPPGAGATPATFTTTVSTGTLAANATQNVTLTGTADLSAAGAYAVTVTSSLTGDENVTNNALTPALTITNSPRVATFSYAGATGTICAGSTTTLTPTLGTGATAGTFSSTTGLTINATTGVINPATSTGGTYTVTNTLPAANGCPVTTATQSITITPATTATFSYAGSPFCRTSTTAVAPTVTGTTGGAFTVSPATGLSINATTGAITPSTSTAGTYTVTYSVTGPCPSSATQTVVITSAPTAAFSYPTAAICAGQTATVAPTLGTGASSGAFTSTTGLTINATTGVITPSTSTAGTYTVTNTVAASGTCAAVTATTSVTVSPATTATFSYAGSPFCRTSTTAVAPTVTGTAGGAFTVSPATGLSINATTGAITPSTSTAGTYTVTYSVTGTCPSSATQTVVITNAPVATFTYPTATICAGQTATVTPTLGTGATAGTFSSTTGLTINGTTGVISPSTSTAGTYTVTNTIAAANGCATITATQSVTILPVAVATFNYGTTSTFCVSGTTNASVTLGTGATAGTFSSTTGLTLNATTGAITLSSSTPGTYTVTNTVAASGSACGNTATSTVTITAAPVATFTYPTATICAGQTATVTPTLGTGATAGTFSSTTGLTINAATGVITPSTSTAGTYTVTNTIAAANGCATITATQSVTILPVAVATFNYGTTSTFCVSGTTNPIVTLGTGATAGTFSSTTGLTINATTGAITLASSTPGTYTVTNTVAASGSACGSTATSTVTITAAPVATFSYPATTACQGSTAVTLPTLGTGATAGTFSSTAGLTINATTGAITLSSSTAGTYTVTNTVAAAGGCAAATATATFTVTPRPAAPVLTATYNGTTTTLTSSAATGNQFYLNNVLITGATGTTYTVTGLPAQLGSYTVTTTNPTTGCVSLPSNVLVVTGSKNSIAGTSLRLFPNPTPTGQVTLELTGFRLTTQLTVLDALGRVVSSQVLPANAGTAVHALDLSSVATGVYLLQLRNADGVQTQRLVRE